MEGQRPDRRSDEIDISEVFSRIGGAFGRGWMRFMRFLATLRRIPSENRIVFIAAIIVSIGFGAFFSTLVGRKFYESSMMFSCDYLNTRLAEHTVGKLDRLAREQNKHGLSKALGIPDSVAKNIIGFSLRTTVNENDIVEIEVLKEQLQATQNGTNQKMIQEVIERIELENRHTFEITVRTLSPTVIPNLQEGLVHYLLSNPYLKKRIEENKIALQKEERRLLNDVQKMDSLKAVVNDNFRTMASQRQGSNNVILSDRAVSDPVQIYGQALIIYDLLKETQTDLYLSKDFEIVDDFTQFSEPASPRLAIMLLYSILIGVAVAYAFVGLKHFNKYLANLN